MATNTIDIVTSVLTQKELDAFCSTYNIPSDLRPKLPGPNDTIKDSPEGKIGIYTCFIEFDNFRIPLLKSTILRLCIAFSDIRPPWNFKSLKNWNNHFFWIDASVCPIFVPWYNDVSVKRDLLPSDDIVDLPLVEKQVSEDMGLLAFMSVDPFKVKVEEKKLAENEVSLLTETADRVIAPTGQTIRLVDHNIVDELREADGKKKKKVSGQHDVGSGSAAHPTEDFVSSSITPTPERECHDESGWTQDGNVWTRLASDRFVVLTFGSEPMDTDATISPKVISPIMYVQTEAEATTASSVNEIGAYSILGNEAEASSDDGPLIDDFYESQTIDSAIAHDIYVLNLDVTNDARMDDPVMCRNFIDDVPPPGYWDYLRNRSDAEFLDRLNVNSAQHVCMMSEFRLRYEQEITVREKFEKKFVKSSETVQQRDAEIATLRSKLEKVAGEAADVIVLYRRVSELKTVAAGIGACGPECSK
uniref:Transposase (Putative), gypsy type n=1 Tax=Tanacetum cinerariifolium TaxID=118510 RepID=A0A6L2NRF0_TANCI|nr:transposase (putative), gypsy type [Tanacetum cinerariifolium]